MTDPVATGYCGSKIVAAVRHLTRWPDSQSIRFEMGTLFKIQYY